MMNLAGTATARRRLAGEPADTFDDGRLAGRMT
jgi:hypothetical protein